MSADRGALCRLTPVAKNINREITLQIVDFSIRKLITNHNVNKKNKRKQRDKHQ